MAKWSTDWSVVLTSAPLNKDAACAVSQGGEHYESQKKIEPHVYHNDAPPPMLPPPPQGNITGMRAGRLTVLGRSEKKNSSKQRMWVVRCVCGSYEHRTAKAIKSAEGSGHDRCADCQRLKYIQEEDRKRQTGSGRYMPLRWGNRNIASVFDTGASDE